MSDSNELYRLLLKHLAMYPNMQIQDMVKLIYQNEFGCEHLISDKLASSIQLQTERATPRQKDLCKIHFEEIGNGFYRFNLSSLATIDIKLDTLNRFFTIGSNSGTGTILSFERKLGVLKHCCKDGLLPFSIKKLESYLRDYRRKGYPVVDHSEIYRHFYRPAYRVIKTEFYNYWDLFCKIDRLMEMKNTVTVAIDGNCGAGKTFLGGLLQQVYDCNVLHMDHFFLPQELKTKERLAEVGGNVDYVRFRREVLKNLAKDRAFTYQVYDCKVGKQTNYIPVPVKRLNIIEGTYSMHPTLIDSYDLKIFLSIDPNTQKHRILSRNGSLLYQRFICEWIPMENRYFQEMQIMENCDLAFHQS
jgi:deoxyadenosine/deoxycytidine kinase